jgi:hypothetical protein
LITCELFAAIILGQVHQGKYPFVVESVGIGNPMGAYTFEQLDILSTERRCVIGFPEQLFTVRNRPYLSYGSGSMFPRNVIPRNG